MNLHRLTVAALLTAAVATTSIALLSPAHAGDRAAPAEEAWDGTWNVTIKPKWGTCGKGEPSVYQWLLTEDGGKLAIQVLGKTGFPNLTGTVEGKDVVLAGESGPAFVRSTTAMRLHVTARGAMEGDRLLSYAEAGRSCAELYTVAAKKQ